MGDECHCIPKKRVDCFFLEWLDIMPGVHYILGVTYAYC
ncbi:hypothetical protein DSUL_100007 [Desulfovibrionales bacterium]